MVTLLAFTGNPELATAFDRTIYTLVGAAVALVAYLVWPTWASRSLPDTLASLAETEGRAGLPGGRGGSTDLATAVVLVGETDLLVDSIDALGHLFGLVG